MVFLKPSEHGTVQPKPKYGHLSKIAPEFVPLQRELDANFKALWELPIDEFKQGWINAPPALAEDIPVPGKDIQITHQLIPVRDGNKIEIRVYKPIEPEPEALLFLNSHGGGWSVGSHNVEEGQNRNVAAKTKSVVVSVDYRMAPEYKFPYSINDCYDALLWCKENALTLGINPDRIIVSGGSAGGNIAAVLAQMTRNEKVSGVLGQVLNIPVTCHPKHFPADKYEYGSYQQNKDSSIVDAPKMDWFWDQYLPEATAEVYASPLLEENLKGLPPALVQVAGMDPLRDEGLAYAEALKAAGVPVTLKIYPGLPHGFYMIPHLKQSVEYIQSVVDFVLEIQTGSNL
ncbi:hypothetical protein B7463_g7921, partial [Scytalidium lignicola]